MVAARSSAPSAIRTQSASLTAHILARPLAAGPWSGGERPRSFVSFTMHFVVTGAVPDQAMERAIQLSRDKYCSVWHSLRQDILLDTSFEVRS